MKWIAIGFLAGLITAFLSTWVAFIAGGNPNIQISLKEMPFTMLIQLTNAAVYEEPLFRGILWGAMKKMDFEDKWIWIIQAVLFCAGHIYYLNLPIVIWLRTFFAGLVIGAVVWKSRSMMAGMTVHATLNSFGQLFTTFF